MKVADLQQFVSGLVQPVRAAGASDKVCAELRQAAEFLEPFKDRTLAELGSMLHMIDEYKRTNQWPQPPSKPTGGGKGKTPKQPKLTVEQAAQRVMALLERVNDAELEYSAIDSELKAIEPLTKDDLVKVAKEVGMTIAPRATKKDILEEIRRRVRDRKGSFERTQFRADEPGTRLDAQREPPHHVGASNSGNG
jgi:ribosomal protein L18